MTNEDVIHLNLTGCKSAAELHERIRITFGFPDWYGCNWDAFYDLLSTDVEENQVIVAGLSTLPDELHDYIPYVLDVLEDVRKERLAYGDIFSYEIIS